MPPELCIRRLRAEDAPLVQAFVRGLSPQARADRFFSPIRELAPRQLERITLPSDPRDLNLAAFLDGSVIALAQCAVAGDVAEFGVVVADDWRHCGIGEALMQRLLAHAQSAGLARLHGVVRGGNRPMLGLAAKLGFRAERDADPALVRVERPLAGKVAAEVFGL